MLYAPLVRGCQRSPIRMSFPATNPQSPRASCQAGCKGCEQLGLAGGSASPREAEVQWSLLGEGTPISEPAGGRGWACSQLQAQHMSLFVPLLTGLEETTGAVLLTEGLEEVWPRYFSWHRELQHYKPAHAAWPQRAASSRDWKSFPPAPKGSPAAPACQWWHWYHAGLFQLNNSIILPKPHWSFPCRSHWVLTASYILIYQCEWYLKLILWIKITEKLRKFYLLKLTSSPSLVIWVICQSCNRYLHYPHFCRNLHFIKPAYMQDAG